MTSEVLTAIDAKTARDRLSEIQGKIDFQSTTIPLYDIARELKEETIDLRVMQCGNPSYYRLCYDCDIGCDPEEAVFTLDGYITDHTLPPIVNRKQLAKKPLWCQQSVALTGYGDSLFNEACSNLSKISSIFQDALPEGDISMYEKSKWQSYDVMSIANRFFTQQRLAKRDMLAPLKQTIDPNGLLFNFAKQSAHPLVSIKENQVKYYERVVESDEDEFSTLFTKCEPCKFQIGDLVKVDFSFVMFSSADRRHKETRHAITPILRAVYLLDSDVKIKAKQHIKLNRNVGQSKLLKRTLSIQLDGDSDSDEDRPEKRSKN